MLLKSERPAPLPKANGNETQQLASTKPEKRSSTLMIGSIAAMVLLIGAAAIYFALNPDPTTDSTPPVNSNDLVAVTPTTPPPASTPQPVEQSEQSPATTDTQASIPSPPSNTTATETPEITTPPEQVSATPDIIPDTAPDVDPNIAANEYLEKAQQFLAEDAWEQSLEQIKAGLSKAPEHEELLALQSEIEAQLSVETDEARIRRQIEQLLAKALRQWENSQFEEPAGDNASETYRQVLQLQPTNQEAIEGMKRIGGRSLAMKSQQKAQQLLQQGKLEESLEEIERGLNFSPGYDGLLELRDEVELRLKNR